jgi:hypothetical protein
MKNLKIICICLFIFLLGIVYIQLQKSEKNQQKVVLAREMGKVQNNLMFDLSQAHEYSIKGVPADGLWHNRIVFNSARQGALEYVVRQGNLFRVSKGKPVLISDHISDLRLRRQRETPDILEIQIETQKSVELISNLRIRLQQ